MSGKVNKELFLSPIARHGVQISILVSNTRQVAGKYRNKNTPTTDSSGQGLTQLMAMADL